MAALILGAVVAAAPWRTDDALSSYVHDQLASLGTDSCTLPHQFVSADEPFVLRNSSEPWRAFKWTPESLGASFGAERVMPRSPHILANWVPSLSDNGGHVAFSDFISQVRDAASNASIFDRGEAGNTLVERMERDGEWSVPSELRDGSAWHAACVVASVDAVKAAGGSSCEMAQRTLAIGPTGQGFPMHAHGKTWQMQVVGQKLWLLHPPGDTRLPDEWLSAHPMSLVHKGALGTRETRSGASAAPATHIAHHCVLGPGDLLVFPDLWWHATLNLGDSIGIGGEKIATSGAELRRLKESDASSGHVKVHQMMAQRLMQLSASESVYAEHAASEMAAAVELQPLEPGLVRGRPTRSAQLPVHSVHGAPPRSLHGAPLRALRCVCRRCATSWRSTWRGGREARRRRCSRGSRRAPPGCTTTAGSARPSSRRCSRWSPSRSPHRRGPDRPRCRARRPR